MALTDLPGGRRLHYEAIEGPAGGAVLVFLHEGLGCAAMWKGFPRALCGASGLPGLVYDRTGFGRSSPATVLRTPRYLHDSALEELPAVLERTIPGRDYILVGHSDGGSIALIHAASRPRKLRAVVAEAAHVMVEPITLRGIEAAVQAWRAGRFAGLARYHGSRAETVFRAWADAWMDPAFHGWNIEDELRDITCPVLALQGTEDPYGSPAQVEAIRSKVPNGRGVMLEGRGHAPHRERPEKTLKIMRGFILENAAPAAGDDRVSPSRGAQS